MDIEQFNALSAEDAAALLAPCVLIPSWSRDLSAARPYTDRDQLLAAARDHIDGWTPDEVLGALADHPRIGDKPTSTSRAEQAGVPDDAETQARLREGNAAYEERFGRIYLVRAAGRSAEEMLALLEQRLGNDPATELEVTKGQLGEIALLRLEGVVTQ